MSSGSFRARWSPDGDNIAFTHDIFGSSFRIAGAQQAHRRFGGQGVRYLLDTVVMTEPRAVDLIAVDDALVKLTDLDSEQGRVVELRFFGGLTEEETAEVLEVSPATVHRKWLLAKAFLHRELSR